MQLPAASSAIASVAVASWSSACWAARSRRAHRPGRLVATLFVARSADRRVQGTLFSNDRAIIATVTPPDSLGLGQGVSFSGPGLGLTFGLVIGGLLVRCSGRTVIMLFGIGRVFGALLIVRHVPPPPDRRRACRSVGGSDGSPPTDRSVCWGSVSFLAPSPTSSPWRPGTAVLRRGGRADVGRAAAMPPCRHRGLARDGRQRGGLTIASSSAAYGSKTAIVAGLSGLAMSMLAMGRGHHPQRSIRGSRRAVLGRFFCCPIWARSTRCWRVSSARTSWALPSAFEQHRLRRRRRRAHRHRVGP